MAALRDEDIVLYGPPNPALTAILNGNQLRAYLLALAQRAKAIYIATVDRGEERGEEHLYESASAFTERAMSSFGSRWVGVMEVDSGHILPHDFGWEDERDQAVQGEHDLINVLANMDIVS